MSTSSYTVEAVLKAEDSGFSSAFKAAEKSVGGLTSMAGKVGSVFKSVLGANLVSSAITSGIGALTSSIKGAFASAIDEGAKLQQSFGGIDTLYAGATEQVKNYAAEAAKAGISANTYAEQAVSFGASLKQALGGDAVRAAETANRAILSMADNSAKMGTSIESIQNAYQGFAKQNYTMLDNLKLGYGKVYCRIKSRLTVILTGVRTIFIIVCANGETLRALA